MQAAVEALIALGPLPESAAADAEVIKSFEDLLAKIRTPVTEREAKALASLFGPDDCFGLAWSLLHLIETAPSWPIEAVLNDLVGEWADKLRERAYG